MKIKKPETTEDILFYVGHVLILLIVIVSPWLLGHLDDTSWRCLFHQVTGLYCPACGGTRAFAAMLHGHFILSVKYNPVVLYFFVFLAWFMISWYVQKLSGNKLRVGLKFRTAYVYIGLMILMGQCVVKNILLFV